MRNSESFSAKGYADYGDFKAQNRIDDGDLMGICELSRFAIRRYKEGKTVPAPSCVKLVELTKQGAIPRPEWEGFRVTAQGVCPPGEDRQCMTPEDVESRWLSAQRVHELEREIGILQRRLDESRSPLLADEKFLALALWRLLRRGLEVADLPDWIFDEIRVARESHRAVKFQF